MSMNKLGTLKPLFYFVNHRDPTKPEGYIFVAPYSQCPAPEGWSREYADTLPDVDRLQKRLQEQSRREWEAEVQREEAAFEPRQRALRERMRAQMVSSSTSEYDKEFIRLWLALHDDEKREKHRRNFDCRNAYLWIRENDTPKGRGVDEESVNIDRVNF